MADADYKRYRCGFCALEFESPRERRYCSKKCNKVDIKKRKSSVSRTEYLAKVRENSASRFTCEHCGKEAFRKLSGTNKQRGIVNRWCSMQCRTDASTAKRVAENGLPFCKIVAAYCLGCGKPFVSRRRRLYCSDECHFVPDYVSTAPSSMCCKTCGKIFQSESKTKPKECCSDDCLSISKKRLRKIAKGVRRARLRGVMAENVDPIKVFDRDKWRCQLCGIKTPKTKRGSYDDNAPELDHIIPVSKGGGHTYINTQCACRKCNQAKSNRPLGQMLLIG